MLNVLQIRLLFAVVLIFLVGIPLPTWIGRDVPSLELTADQQALVDFAFERFDEHGLVMPDIQVTFRDSLFECDGLKGRYYPNTRTVEMCSLDKITMLHEMAHAWVGENLSSADRDRFVELRGLDSWNNHDHEWALRGTEHAAETIAWALADDPHHVKWVDWQPDGNKFVSHRILTINVDVETLVENFELMTDMRPIFRHPGEWKVHEEEPNWSPEARRGT